MLELSKGMIDSGAVEIRDRLGLISGGRVLDVGTSDGSFIDILLKCLKDFHSFVGVDIEEKELKKARVQFKDDPAEFLVMDAEHLVFDDNSFDTVSISHSLHHLENVDIVLSEIKRVLKPGGYLIIQEMFSDGNQTESQQTDMLIHHWGAEADSYLGVPHRTTFTQRELKDIVSKNGMNKVEIFESNRYVKCLFCSDMVKCDNPFYEDIMNVSLNEINDVLEKINDTPIFERMKEMSESLKARVHQTGTSPASILYFICT